MNEHSYFRLFRWIIIKWTPTNKLQWNFNRNSNIFIQENALENVVCEMASICLDLNVLRYGDAPGLPTAHGLLVSCDFSGIFVIFSYTE